MTKYVGSAGPLSKFGHDQISSPRYLPFRFARLSAVAILVYDVDAFHHRPIDFKVRQ